MLAGDDYVFTGSFQQKGRDFIHTFRDKTERVWLSGTESLRYGRAPLFKRHTSHFGIKLNLAKSPHCKHTFQRVCHAAP